MTLSFGVMLGFLQRAIAEIKDPRLASNATRYSIKDTVLGAFSVFFMQCESFLEHQRQMHSRSGQDNAQNLFGLKQIPTTPQIRNILDEIAARGLFRVFTWVYLLIAEGWVFFALSMSGRTSFGDVRRHSVGKILYQNAFITGHELTNETVPLVVSAGRSRWKTENDFHNVLKTKGYHLEHNFGHGQHHLAGFLLTLNLLAFLFHSVLHLVDKPVPSNPLAARYSHSYSFKIFLASPSICCLTVGSI